MKEQQNPEVEKIEPGMVVEATKGDLGEEDVSKPKVTDIVQDQQGNVEKLIVEKGVVFKKKLDIPADRVQAVEPEPEDQKPGKVVVDVGKKETEQLTVIGEEELAHENQRDLLDQVEREIPTAEGLRELEASNVIKRAKQSSSQTTKAAARQKKPSKDQGDILDEVEEDIPTAEGLRGMEERSQQVGENVGAIPAPTSKQNFFLRVLGPGFLAGMAGNDSSAVTAYSVDGATNGYGHLWLLLLSTPLYQTVQFASAKLGRITQMGLAEILRTHYSRWVAIPAALILIVANLSLIAADLVAIGSGLQLITKISWVWFVIPVGAILWYITVFRNFESIKKIFIALSLAFAAYIITAIFSGANWGSVLFNTFVPQIDFSFASISSAVALLGATISPYTVFWQVQGEKEEQRTGTIKQQVRGAAIDIAIGVISGNLVSFFIIVCTAATLFAHHHNINTAADAAKSLEPLVGPFAEYLFALGFIGAGIVAIPVLLASTSYAVAGTFGWPAGLSKKPWQNEGFYLILTTGIVISIVIALLRLDPIQLMFWANVLNGVLSPFLVVYLIVIGNSRKIMHDQKLGWLTNLGMVLTALVMFAAAVLLFYGLLTGRGS